jgi:hypothetical protein
MRSIEPGISPFQGSLPALDDAKLRFCAGSGKSGSAPQFSGRNRRFPRHKILKSRPFALSKAGSR